MVTRKDLCEVRIRTGRRRL
ncbi:Hok/Gef family protein [Escherichia coli]|nr:Hok/Gef family protein [Escherichia coli]